MPALKSAKAPVGKKPAKSAKIVKTDEPSAGKKLVGSKVKRKKPSSGGGNGPAKVIVKDKKTEWKKSDIARRDRDNEKRSKTPRKVNPNKAEKVMERHQKNLVKNPNAKLSDSVVKTRSAIKKATSKLSTNAKKAGSKTRSKAANAIKAMSPKDLAKSVGVSPKEMEAAATEALSKANDGHSGKGFDSNVLQGGVGSTLRGIAAFAIKTVVVGAAATLVFSVMPPSILNTLVFGLLSSLGGMSSRAFVLANDGTDDEAFNEDYMPNTRRLIPLIADYVRDGALEEVFGMIAGMELDAENDDAGAAIHKIESKKKALTVESRILPSSIKQKIRIGFPRGGVIENAGFYLCWSVEQFCAMRLASWAKLSGLPNPEPAGELHCTIVYSKTVPYAEKSDGSIYRFPAIGLLPNKILARPLSLKKLGPNAIVLTIECIEANARFQEVINFGASHSFPSYIAHVTVAKDLDGEWTTRRLKKIPLPNFRIAFDYEYSASLKEATATVNDTHSDSKEVRAAKLSTPGSGIDRFMRKFSERKEAGREQAPGRIVFTPPKTSLFKKVDSGAIFMLQVDPATETSIRKYVRENRLVPDRGTEINPHHCTIIKSVSVPDRNKFATRGRLPKSISAKIVGIRRLNSSLVFEIQSNDVLARRKEAMAAGAKPYHVNESWFPHVTFADARHLSDKEIQDLPNPTFVLHFDRELGSMIRKTEMVTPSFASALMKNKKRYDASNEVCIADVLVKHEITAGRRKKEALPDPVKHNQRASKNIVNVLSFFDKFDLASKIDKLREYLEKAKAAKTSKERKQIAKELYAFSNAKGNGLNNDFYSKALEWHQHVTDLALSLNRLCKKSSA
jgi:hypothetical protein